MWMPVAVFLVLLIHGAMLGLTDDEAYYWVLAQKPALGYAFHPPAVAWMIALTQKLLGGFISVNHPGVVRFSAAVFSAGIMALGLFWIRSVVADQCVRLGYGAMVLLSFAGFFGASWMMVPDLPMLFGWMLMFVASWELCFRRASWRVLIFLLSGTALAILSKYSGVLAVVSAITVFWLWAPPLERARGYAALIIGIVLAGLPILVWNAKHDWASLLYQIRDRHGDLSLSPLRFVQFWLIQALLAGPPLLFYSLTFFKRLRVPEKRQLSAYILIWAVPAALVFCLQPLWAEFKPHWAFVVWLPFALELALDWSQGRSIAWARVQCVYGLSVLVVALILCHIPGASWLMDKFGRPPLQPQLDVTNDMYGWDELSEFLKARNLALPIVGSRYQTSSQAAFAIGALDRVSFLPRDLKQRDEWPDLKISEGQGPAWPKITASVLYVADNRYDSGPEFPGASCSKIGRLEKYRWKYLAKWIDVWRCDP
jgi:4-amino-4-deoxy-L-arabinose transferase-like glycosyltransferase